VSAQFITGINGIDRFGRQTEVINGNVKRSYLVHEIGHVSLPPQLLCGLFNLHVWYSRRASFIPLIGEVGPQHVMVQATTLMTHRQSCTVMDATLTVSRLRIWTRALISQELITRVISWPVLQSKFNPARRTMIVALLRFVIIHHKILTLSGGAWTSSHLDRPSECGASGNCIEAVTRKTIGPHEYLQTQWWSVPSEWAKSE